MPGEARTFLTAEWRDLVMLNYEIDPSLLRSRVPRGTALDAFGGRTFVSVVAFHFLNTRVLGFPIPFHRNFDEVNLRFYVAREGPDGVRRGVVFVKEIVPRAAIAWLARRVYNENYVALPMRSRVELSAPANGAGNAMYEWCCDGSWSRAFVEVRGTPTTPEPDSLESFITEHYWGYAAQPNGSTVEYQVEHPRWRVWRATQAELACGVQDLYGKEFVEPLLRLPASAFAADGSAVVVRRGVRIR
jgi:uncharacterized protein YqjF (DUF2071 family)